MSTPPASLLTLTLRNCAFSLARTSGGYNTPPFHCSSPNPTVVDYGNRVKGRAGPHSYDGQGKRPCRLSLDCFS
ncbi:hypothetical protein M413DRAFT_280241 [Hebeloma cylindrosporum]|uniref:Uncharacterized protein n=1 Tax=Hebeloma cylindrosporum TaxID=76867 RepID=A0A0C3BJT3_HEBCY|nr:hypothetical protein M413DRAFT_280241 [Hebeloma cylindrosporum h7]